jgi:hypothetical protein
LGRPRTRNRLSEDEAAAVAGALQVLLRLPATREQLEVVIELVAQIKAEAYRAGEQRNAQAKGRRDAHDG